MHHSYGGRVACSLQEACSRICVPYPLPSSYAIYGLVVKAHRKRLGGWGRSCELSICGKGSSAAAIARESSVKNVGL